MSEVVKRGFKRLLFGFWQFDGVLLSGLHPSKITISDDAVVFKYGDVDRSYGLVKSGGKISSVTFPDGHVMEVVRNG